MTSNPRLTVGLPVYNGENYLAAALDALLGQSFDDFELIISDNASTDGTESICRRYAAEDSRVRYLRQRSNVGANPNHYLLIGQARGELFKWAAHDDLYGRDLLKECVSALDAHPEAVLAHTGKAIVDERNQIVTWCEYTLDTGSPHPAERFRSVLFASGGDDEYGVIRTGVLRSLRPYGSYHNASRPFIAELALRGPFQHVPELLYFRRDHPERGDRNPTIRAVCTNFDPRRANHSTARLFAEYVVGFTAAISRAPLAAAERRRCYGHFAGWLLSSGIRRAASRSLRPFMRQDEVRGQLGSEPSDVVSAIVAGSERSVS